MILEEWNKDPEFKTLPQEKKKAILLNYFDKELTDEDFHIKLSEPEQENIRYNFLASEGFIPALTPGRLKGALKAGSQDVIRHTLSGLGASLEYASRPHEAFAEHDPAGFVGSLTPEGRKSIKEMQDKAASEILKVNPEFKLSSGFIEDVTRLAPQYASQIIASVLMGPPGGIGIMGLQITGGTYDDLVSQGVEKDRALAAGLANAALQAPLEQIGISRGLKFWKTRNTLIKKLKELIGVAGTEYITELSQSVPEAITNIWAKNPDKATLEQFDIFLDQGWDMLKQGNYEGLVAATLSAFTFGLGGAIQGKRVKQEPTQEAPPEEVDRNALLADIQAQFKAGQITSDDILELKNDPDMKPFGIETELNDLILQAQAAEEPIDLTEVVGREFDKMPSPVEIEGKPVPPEERLVIKPKEETNFLERAKERVGGKQGVEERVEREIPEPKEREHGKKLTDEERQAMLKKEPKQQPPSKPEKVEPRGAEEGEAIQFKNYEEVQQAIDDLETKLFGEGLSYEESEANPELTKLYEIRNKIGQKELEQSHKEIGNLVDKKISDKKLTNKILKDIYEIDPKNPTGQYFAAKYTQKQVENRKETRRKLFELLQRDYEEKNNLEPDMIFSNISGLTRKGQENLIKQLTGKAANIETSVYEYFNGKPKSKAPKPEEGEKKWDSHEEIIKTPEYKQGYEDAVKSGGESVGSKNPYKKASRQYMRYTYGFNQAAEKIYKEKKSKPKGPKHPLIIKAITLDGMTKTFKSDTAKIHSDMLEEFNLDAEDIVDAGMLVDGKEVWSGKAGVKKRKEVITKEQRAKEEYEKKLKGDLISIMRAENIKNFSDSELKRILEPTVSGHKLIPEAKRLIAEGKLKPEDVGIKPAQKFRQGNRLISNKKAEKAKTARQFVRHMGGLYKDDPMWSGEIKDLWENCKRQPGIRTKKGLSMERMLEAFQQFGWNIKDGNDLLDALTNNRKKDTVLESQDFEDQLVNEEIERLKENGEDKKEISEIIRSGEEEADEQIVDKISKQEGERPEDVQKRIDDWGNFFDEKRKEEDEGPKVKEQLGMFGPTESKKGELKLTPEKETPHEKAARLEREGLVKRPKKEKKKAKFPEEGIKPGTGGKQTDLFKEQDLDLFNQEEVKKEIRFNRTPRPPSLPKKSRIRMATTGWVRAAGWVAGNVDQAASLLASIRRSAQENAYLISTNKDGVVLEIHRITKGGISSSMVPGVVAAGRALNLPEVTQAYFAHNHPSGITKTSTEDKTVARGLSNILSLKDIKLKSFVIGGTTYQEFTPTEDIGTPRPIKAVARKLKIPVKERYFKSAPTKTNPITNPIEAKKFIEDNGYLEGFYFLDNKNRPVGFTPFKSGIIKKELTRQIIQEAEATNARMYFVYFKGDELSGQRKKYLWAFNDEIAKSDLNILDVIVGERSLETDGTLEREITPKTKSKISKWPEVSGMQTLLSVADKPLTSSTKSAILFNKGDKTHDLYPFEKRHTRQLTSRRDREEQRVKRFLGKGIAENPAYNIGVAISDKPLPPFTRKHFKNLQEATTMLHSWLKRAGASDEVLKRIQIDLKPVIDLTNRRRQSIEESLANWETEGRDIINNILGATTVKKYHALIELALNNQDLSKLERTTYHEFFHVASKWILPAKDYDILMKHFKTEEGAAEAFADYVKDYKAVKHPSLIRRIFLKLRRMLRLIHNGLNKKGFTRPEDIFGRLMVGDYTAHFGLQGATRAEVGAWHGGPHKFDKFSTEKIGTGEGGQAFGWGIYFTDLKDIADHYANQLSRGDIYIDNERMITTHPEADKNEILRDTLSAMKSGGLRTLDKAIDWLKDIKPSSKKYIKERKDAIDFLKSGRVKVKTNRNLYKVTLHKGKKPGEYEWLRWDKPVTDEQASKIKKQLKNDSKISSFERPGIEPYLNEKDRGGQNLNGQIIYQQIQRAVGSQKQASLFLLRAGIDGIKYPSGTLSGVQGSDAFNYVVFDENAVTIEEATQFALDTPQSPESLAKALIAKHTVKKPKAKAKVQKLEKSYDQDIQDDSLDVLNDFKGWFDAKKKGLKWAPQKKDITLFDMLLSVPLHYAKKVPNLGKMFNAALEKPDRRYELIEGLSKDEVSQQYTQKAGDALKKQRPEEYKKIASYLLHRDKNAIGYKVTANEETKTFELFDPKGNKVGEFNHEAIAWEQAVFHEVKDYKAKNPNASDQALEFLRLFRTSAHKGFDLYIHNLKEIIAWYESRGKEPVVVLESQRGRRKQIQIDFRVALAEMGDRRGYYFPRKRKSGQYALRAKKTNARGQNIANPVLKFYDIALKQDPKDLKDWKKAFNAFTPLGREARRLEKQGYKVTVDVSDRLPEDVYEMVAPYVGTQAVMNEVLGKITEKEWTLEDFGLSMIDRGTGPGKRDFIVHGPTPKSMTATLKKMGGKYWSSTPGEPKAWHFGNARKGFEDKLVKALMSDQDIVDHQMKTLFAQFLAEEYANIIKARGFRGHMVKRADVTGIDVWTGYEEDPTIAIAQYIRDLAGGESKREMALKMVRAFTGTDVTWQEYKAEAAERDEKADYDEYLDFVEERRVHPTKQRKAFKDGKIYMEHMLRNEEAVDRLVGTIKGLAVLKYLAGRVSAPFVNLTALATSVPATMNAYGNIPIHKVPHYLAKASKGYYDYRWGKTKPPKWVKDLFEEIETKGWHKAQYNREALSVLQSKVGRGWDKAIEWSMLAFGATEQLNRISTIAGAYMAIKSQTPAAKFDHDTALKTAKEISDKAHAVYGKQNYPYLARGGKLARLIQLGYVFKTFSHNYLLTMKEVGLDQKNAKAFAYMAISPAVLAGTGALVGKQVIFGLINLILKAFGMDSDDPEESFYDWINETFGEYPEYMARFGVLGIPRMNLKGSLEIGITDIPTSLIELLGAPGSIVEDFYYGGKSMVKGDWAKGFEKILPNFMGNMIRSVREGTQGVTGRNNAPVFFGTEQLMPDMIDSVYRFLSFNPARIAKAREIQWKERKIENKYQERRRDIYDKIRKFYSRSPEKRLKSDWLDILEEIEEYNARIKRKHLYPAISPITSKSIRDTLRRGFRPSKRERVRAYKQANK